MISTGDALQDWQNVILVQMRQAGAKIKEKAGVVMMAVYYQNDDRRKRSMRRMYWLCFRECAPLSEQERRTMDNFIEQGVPFAYVHKCADGTGIVQQGPTLSRFDGTGEGLLSAVYLFGAWTERLTIEPLTGEKLPPRR